ncbi:hypothetical protein [Nocardioides sp.]|uniref:hypothetical protein n=1 Tax=Nocardioides sp. TaxID=35761 RepID=UPI002C042B45|nr:hypothetical protein [Nocardioides sp.]HSX67605.1 hypothetical protein [Nocardioides sp.]
MSYDLAVWDGPKPASNADASAEYERRMDAMEEALDGSDEPAAPTERIKAFVEAALARFPELDDNSGPECPWASSPLEGEAVGDLIYLPMTFSGAEYARDVLAEIADSLGLVCFDPQIEQLLPDAQAVPAATVSASAYAALAQHLQAEKRSQESGWFSRLFKRKQQPFNASTRTTTGTIAATHRAELESGEVMNDPSDDGLFMLFDDLESGRSGYLIVDDLRDPSGHTYAQSSRNDDGTYLVEYRAGGADRHFRTTAPDMRAAHALIVGWTFDIQGWREAATWEPVTF